MSDHKAAIEKLGPMSSKLGKLDDEILQAIATIESELRRHVSVRITTDIPEGRLAFGKVGGEWGLIIEAWYCMGGRGTLLCKAAREVRVKVITNGYIEQLIRHAPAQLDESIAEREMALAEVERIFAAMGGE